MATPWNRRFSLVSLLSILAFVLGACASPAPAATVVPATAVPATAVPATAVPATAVPATAVPTQPPVVPTETAAATASPVATAEAHVKATSVSLFPSGLAFDTAGNLFIAGCGGQEPTIALFKVDLAGLLTAYAGEEPAWEFSGDGGPALAAQFRCPQSLAFDHAGNLYVSDAFNQRIRRIDATGAVDTVIGSGEAEFMGGGTWVPGGFSGDGGPADAARLDNPGEIVFDADGNLYFVDQGNARIRKVDTKGIITTIAGTGEIGFDGDGGPATAAKLNPTYGLSLAIDKEGNLYVADTFNARVRKIDRAGIITTFAGTGQSGFSGDGGPATEAQLSGPTGLAFDAEGNLYVATAGTPTSFDTRIRKIDKQGIITTFAGTGQLGFGGDGEPATSTVFNHLSKLVFDSDGNLYVIDDVRVRKVDKQGVITTIAGRGV